MYKYMYTDDIITSVIMAELVRAEKMFSDWFPEQSEFSYGDC